MKSAILILLLISTTSIIFLGCKKDDVPQQTIEESISDAVAEVQQLPEISQFANRLKSAYTKGFNLSSTELEAMSGVTIFAVIDNPYWSTDTDNDLNMVKNHIVKGKYHKSDLKQGTKLQTITGEEITISFYGFDIADKTGITYLNNSVYLDEIAEVDGNIIHTVTSPIFCNMEEIDLIMNDCIDFFKQYIQYYYLFDAIYTDESGAINSSWEPIDKHTFNPSNDKIEKLYYDAYNVLVRTATIEMIYDERGRMPFTSNDETILSLYTKALPFQAYTYSCLLTYFNNVPLLNENVPVNNKIRDYSKLLQINSTDLSQYILSYLIIGNGLAPEDTQNGIVFTKDAISALQIRSFVSLGSLSGATQARHLAEQVMNKGKYSLEKNVSSVYTTTSSETVQGYSFPINNELGMLYAGRNIIPISRYTGILLDYAWAAIFEGLIANAKIQMDLINNRSGFSGINFESKSQMNEDLFKIISREIKMEGQRFSILKRFNKAEQILNIQIHQKFLPIPQKQIIANPNFVQNPGY
jgi:hypothetical protein